MRDIKMESVEMRYAGRERNSEEERGRNDRDGLRNRRSEGRSEEE